MTSFVKAIYRTHNIEHPFPSPLIMGAVGLFIASSMTHAASIEESNSNNVASLPVIQVNAEQSTSTEQTKSYTVPQSSASTGLSLSLKETPQSVSVVTRQQLDDKSAQSIGDVIAATTGISFKELDNGGRTTYRARGFDVTNYKSDGLSIAGGSGFSGAGNSINMDLYDHVNIVRGANGLLGGTGDPSASIDLVRKLPENDFKGSLKLRTGSWDKKNIVGDINVPLAADGRLRSRLVVSSEDSDGFRDHENLKRQGALASIMIDVADSTTLGMGFQYEKSEMKGASWGTNVPIWFADGTRTHFSRKFNPVTDWSKSEREGQTFFTSLESHFDNDWKITSRYSHTERTDLSNIGIVKVNGSGSNYPHWNQDGTGAYLNAIHQEIESKNNALELTLSGPFRLFGRQHELMFGFNGSDTESTSWTFNSSNCRIDGIAGFRNNCQYRVELPVENWQTWRGDEYSNFSTFRTGARAITNTQLYGGYAAAHFNLMDDLSLITGIRRSNYKTYVDNYNVAGEKSSRGSQNSAQVWTPYYGLVYDITPTYAVYASYTDVFTPQTQQDINGRVLKPITGESYEAGIKGAWFDDNLNASLAVFNNKQANLAVSDANNTTPDGSQAYFESTGRKTQGFETEVSGALTPTWNIFAGYTYLGIKDESTADRADPRHLFRFNTTYDLSNVLDGLIVGTGMSWQSNTITSPNPGRPTGQQSFDSSPIAVKGYALFDAMSRYKINDHLSVGLNVSNLFDKKYYREFGFYNGLIYGEPRKFTLTLQAGF
ncbi:TonB-dependent siderophore receptor [Acinetobacter sp.]|jgi:outer membrane receptor for ferric coprogen and ferric-rhodotorulic acid|uniref:TonB-dependent siderophore receptor n=1 Tax=Acinetobacter sp. TaxID=472 RepID=UPI00283234C1|nr:TonB-dependent siderophore receptor [Acinetobacter sp.]MDR0236026.1 TonB-dependent siderophore receptor [Acinetobacter sp.]